MAIVKAVFEQAVQTTACPTCEAEAGTPCEDSNTLHWDRFEAFLEELGGPDVLRKRIHRAGVMAKEEV